jgi:hypothetical protein
MSYSVRSLGRPVVCRCPSGCIEAELRYLVLGVAAWPGEAAHPGTIGTSCE